MRIFISKRSVIWLLCMIIGVGFFVRGIVEYEKYRDGMSFSELDVTSYKSGAYIRDDITDFQKVDIWGEGKYTGQYGELDFYDVYLVPVKNGDYVRVMVKYQETKELLEKAANYDTNPVSFAGVIIEEEDLSVSSYSRNDGFDTSRVVSELLVKQKTSGNITNTIYLGVDLIIIGLFMNLTGFAEGSYIADEREEKEKQRRKPIKSYNVENDILAEQKKLAMLVQQNLFLQKNFRLSRALLIGGLLLFLIVPMELKVYVGLLMPFAAKGCLEYWLHQPNTTSAILAGIFGVTPIHRKITECQEMIEKLERSRVKEEPIIMLETPEEEDELALIEKGYTVRQDGEE